LEKGEQIKCCKIGSKEKKENIARIEERRRK